MHIGKTAVLKSAFEGSSLDPGGYAVAIHSGIFSYGGWQVQTSKISFASAFACNEINRYII